MPKRGGRAFWLSGPCNDWSDKYEVERSSPLEISTTQYAGEKRVANAGLYVAGERQWLNKRKPDDLWRWEVVRPFDTDEVVSLNILRTGSTPKGWLDFTNKYGLIGHTPVLDRWHLGGKEKRAFIANTDHEGEWHHLINVLVRIYEYYPAIRDRNSGFLSSRITWFSDDAVHEDRGQTALGMRLAPAIAMRGKHKKNAHYFENMSRPDVLVPAAIVLSDRVNQYLEKSLSLEISFDPKSLEFKSSLKYGSLGAAIVAEAAEFVAGRLEARECSVCGTWFRIGASHKRKDRIFCSAACKMRDYRARKSVVPNSRLA